MWYFVLVVLFFIAFVTEHLTLVPGIFVLVAALCFVERPLVILGGAFVGGLLVDVGYGRWMGQSSVLFVVMAYLFYLYRKRFSEGNLYFLTGVVILFVHIYKWHFFGLFRLYLGESVVAVVLTIFLSYLIYYLKERTL